VETIIKRNRTPETERAVNESPAQGYLPNSPTNQCQRNDEDASDETGLEYPDVAHRVDERTNEEHSNNYVGKSQPIRAVGDPRVPSISISQAISSLENPRV
jgi:hypothetical protein